MANDSGAPAGQRIRQRAPLTDGAAPGAPTYKRAERKAVDAMQIALKRHAYRLMTDAGICTTLDGIEQTLREFAGRVEAARVEVQAILEADGPAEPAMPAEELARIREFIAHRT